MILKLRVINSSSRYRLINNINGIILIPTVTNKNRAALIIWVEMIGAKRESQTLKSKWNSWSSRTWTWWPQIKCLKTDWKPWRANKKIKVTLAEGVVTTSRNSWFCRISNLKCKLTTWGSTMRGNLRTKIINSDWKTRKSKAYALKLNPWDLANQYLRYPPDPVSRLFTKKSPNRSHIPNHLILSVKNRETQMLDLMLMLIQRKFKVNLSKLWPNHLLNNSWPLLTALLVSK